MAQSDFEQNVTGGTGQEFTREVAAAFILMLESQHANFAESLGNIVSSVTGHQQTHTLSINQFRVGYDDPNVWMKFYERVCEANRWNSVNLKVLNLLNSLSDDDVAKKWFYATFSKADSYSWEDWKRRFQEAFGQNKLELAKQAHDFCYSEGNLMAYYFEKIRLIQFAYGPLPDRVLIIMVLLGLPDQIQEILYLRDPATLEDLQRSLARVVTPPQGGRDEPEDDKTEFHEAGFEVMSSSRVESSQLLMESVLIQGKEVNALLDTGSSVNLVRKDVVAAQKWRCKSVQEALKGFNGSTQLVTQAVDIEVESRGVKARDAAFVVGNMAYEAIIGLPTLKKLGYHLVQSQNRGCHTIISSKENVLHLFPRIGEFRGEPSCSIDFKLKADAPVIKRKPYRLSREKYAWAQLKVQDLLNRNIIRPSESPYASPCVIVPKEDGTWRLCQDFREVNNFTDLDPFPFPVIDDIICNFGGCCYFSKIDLKDGFHQLPLSEATKQYTAFVLPFGHYEYNNLPFGWKNSPSKFQRYMTKVLGDLLQDSLIYVYIDDIIIGGRSKEECSNKTSLVLKKLMDANLRVNLEKSSFLQPKITFLGRTVDGLNKTTKEESVIRVRNMQRPHDLHTLRVFTGLTGHFRAFIPNYAEIVRPLDRMKAKGAKFEWTEEAQHAFDTLVTRISSNPILQLPDWDLKFELVSDASYYGCGAILYQRDPSKKKSHQLRVVGYYSHTFTPAELNYSVTDKEGLAVVKGIQYFKTYLESRDFIVHTDHEALTSIMTNPEPKGRLARWQVFLMGYNITLNHRSGTLLSDADAVSRLCIETPKNKIVNLVQKAEDGRIMVQPEDIQDLLKSYHDHADSGGHDGFLRTYKKLKCRFIWPKMKQSVLSYVQSCHECQVSKFKYKPKPDEMIIPKHAEVTFETLHLDFAELAKKSEGTATTKSFLVVVDESSRYCFAKAMKESAQAIINYLREFPNLDKVKKIVSDNAPQFTSAALQTFATEHGIRLVTASPYHPAGNGLVERKIRDIKLFIAHYPTFRGGWKACLEAAINHLNRSYSAALGCSPHYMAFGKPALFPADERYGITANMIRETPWTEDQKKNYHEKMKKYFDDRHRSQKPKIREGDSVLVQLGIGSKSPTVTGPFKVKKVISMNGFPKTIVYDNENGTEKVAAIKNVLFYHCRSNV